MRGLAEYGIARVDQNKKIVWIVDHDVGASVTNCAEGVCANLNERYPDYRIIYRDTDGNWDELVHEHGVFKNFAPAREMRLP